MIKQKQINECIKKKIDVNNYLCVNILYSFCQLANFGGSNEGFAGG